MAVLDSWALLAYLKDEPSAGRIEAEWLAKKPAICSINLGEVLYMRIRESGVRAAANDIAGVRKTATIVDPDWDLVEAAANLKARGGLAYADAFCVATAQRFGAPLLTGDPEIIDASDDLSCEVVDLRI